MGFALPLYIHKEIYSCVYIYIYIYIYNVSFRIFLNGFWGSPSIHLPNVGAHSSAVKYFSSDVEFKMREAIARAQYDFTGQGF